VLLIPTYLKEVSGKGIGLFTNKDCKKGEIWWEWNGFYDQYIFKESLTLLPQCNQDEIRKYSVVNDKGDFMLCLDSARFNNHSNKPNSLGIDYRNGVASKCIFLFDVPKDTEITVNYLDFKYDYPMGKLDFEIK